MEKLKPFSEVTHLDERNLIFVHSDTGEPSTIEEHHAEVAAIVLNPSVPDAVRSYFATIQNIYLYAWFAYDFYAVVEFLSFTAIEMALRKRLPYPGKGEDRRALRNLMDQAISKNLIKGKSFSHIREMRKNLADYLRRYRFMGRKISTSELPKSDYAKTLSEVMPSLRNRFAHPRGHQIMMPHEALFQLQLTAEFINQLFAP